MMGNDKLISSKRGKKEQRRRLMRQQWQENTRKKITHLAKLNKLSGCHKRDSSIRSTSSSSTSALPLLGKYSSPSSPQHGQDQTQPLSHKGEEHNTLPSSGASLPTVAANNSFSQTTSSNHQSPVITFGAKKRPLTRIDFVYPKKQKQMGAGKVGSYQFRMKQFDFSSNRQQKHKNHSQVQPKFKNKSESLESILYPTKKLEDDESISKSKQADAPRHKEKVSRINEKYQSKERKEEKEKHIDEKNRNEEKTSAKKVNSGRSDGTGTEEPSHEGMNGSKNVAAPDKGGGQRNADLPQKKPPNHQVQHTTDNKVGQVSSGEKSLPSAGRLSGLSVEDAVRDKQGCRPRANSTDFELNLPQRGLCDEQKVLLTHKWNLDSLAHGPPKGLKNLGNTCFLSATLQCLAYLPPLYQSLTVLQSGQERSGVHCGSGRKPSTGKKFTLMLRGLFRRLHGINKEATSSISPTAIVKAIPMLGSCTNRTGYKFRAGRQEDAHEFLVHLLDAMHDGELREAGINQHKSGWRDRLPIPRLDETTFVHRIFGGYLRSQIRCTACGHRSNTYDPFLDLSLEVSRKSCRSISSALKEFTRKETLDSDNRWKCSSCKKRICATKQLTVFRPPLALCIQLKRFTYSGSGGWGGGLLYGGHFSAGGFKKISKPIEFPAKLDLSLSDSRSCAYHLVGVIIHVGSSAMSGHYTACVKKPDKHGLDQWHHIDDSYTSRVTEREVLKQKDAYLLFYCRQEVKLAFPSPPLRSSMSATEAKEFGEARARARADSLTDGKGVTRGTSKTFQEKASKPQNFDYLSRESKVIASDKAFHPSHPIDDKKRIISLDTKNHDGTNVQAPDGNIALSSDSSSSVPSSSTSGSSMSTSESERSDTEPFSSGEILSNDFVRSNGTACRQRHKKEPFDEYNKGLPTKTITEGVKSKQKAKFSLETCDNVDGDQTLNGTAGKQFDHVLLKNTGSVAHNCKSNNSASVNGDGTLFQKHNSHEKGNIFIQNLIPGRKNLQASGSSATSCEESSSTSGSDDETNSVDATSSKNRRKEISAKELPSPPGNRTLQSDKNTSNTCSNAEGAVMGSRSNEKELASPTKKKKPKDKSPRTRIVLDRGKGYGKVEVMIGPRYKSKAWKPPMTVRNSTDEHAYDLLGNVQVDQWKDDDIVGNKDVAATVAEPSSVQKVRSKAVKQIQRDESSRKRKMFLDRWDAMLDKGKKKKIKEKKEGHGYLLESKPQENAFQRIQSSVHRMNRGRTKGYLLQHQTHKRRKPR